MNGKKWDQIKLLFHLIVLMNINLLISKHYIDITYILLVFNLYFFLSVPITLSHAGTGTNHFNFPSKHCYCSIRMVEWMNEWMKNNGGKSLPDFSDASSLSSVQCIHFYINWNWTRIEPSWIMFYQIIVLMEKHCSFTKCFKVILKRLMYLLLHIKVWQNLPLLIVTNRVSFSFHLLVWGRWYMWGKRNNLKCFIKFQKLQVHFVGFIFQWITQLKW